MASKKPATPLGRAVARIQVGEDMQDFVIHKDLLCHHSPYFKAAFTSGSGFEESQTGVMKLPETDVEVFDLFFNWLYTQSLWDEAADEADWPVMHDLIQLYVFADRARIPRLMNQCLDALNSISVASNEIPIYDFSCPFENAAACSPLRRFLIDCVVWGLNGDFFAELIPKFPEEERLELLVAMKAAIDQTTDVLSPLRNMSNYHQPEDLTEAPKAAPCAKLARPPAQKRNKPMNKRSLERGIGQPNGQVNTLERLGRKSTRLRDKASRS